MNLPEKIVTERLIIRPFCQQDLEGYLDFMTNEEATRYLNFTAEQKTADGAKALFDFVVASYTSENPIFAYVIALQDNTFIGSCGISELDGPEIVECYYSLQPDHWRQGYATEATQALIRHCFEADSIKEVRAYMSPDNPASARVAEKVGMTYLGIQKHPLFENEGKAYAIKK